MAIWLTDDVIAELSKWIHMPIDSGIFSSWTVEMNSYAYKQRNIFQNIVLERDDKTVDNCSISDGSIWEGKRRYLNASCLFGMLSGNKLHWWCSKIAILVSLPKKIVKDKLCKLWLERFWALEKKKKKSGWIKTWESRQSQASHQ